MFRQRFLFCPPDSALTDIESGALLLVLQVRE